MLCRKHDQCLRLLLCLSPVAEELMEGPITEEGLTHRVGMSQLPSGGERLVAPRSGLSWIA